MTNKAFLISYEGSSRNGNFFNPYKAIVHTADEAIAIINTWKTYGKKDSQNDWEKIKVNAPSEKKIRELFAKGFAMNYDGNKSDCMTLRTTGCGCWDIVIRPALADTLEDHLRIYNERRELAKHERLRKAEEVKQRRLAELNEQKRGWYHVELEIRLSVFNNHGNDYRTDETLSCIVIANSGMDAYDKAVKDIKNDSFTHRGNFAVLESWAEPTSHGYEFLFLGVKTDDGYSVEKWEEWKRNGEI